MNAAMATRPVVEIQGPLGKLSMAIPAFVNVEHDVEGRKAYVSVADKEVKKQREMWGMFKRFTYYKYIC